MLKISNTPVGLLIIKVNFFNNKNVLSNYKKKLKKIKKIDKTGNGSGGGGKCGKKVTLLFNSFLFSVLFFYLIRFLISR